MCTVYMVQMERGKSVLALDSFYLLPGSTWASPSMSQKRQQIERSTCFVCLHCSSSGCCSLNWKGKRGTEQKKCWQKESGRWEHWRPSSPALSSRPYYHSSSSLSPTLPFLWKKIRRSCHITSQGGQHLAHCLKHQEVLGQLWVLHTK